MATSDKPAKPELSEREKKLAEALRANLRRRKTERPAKAPCSELGPSDDKSS